MSVGVRSEMVIRNQKDQKPVIDARFWTWRDYRLPRQDRAQAITETGDDGHEQAATQHDTSLRREQISPADIIKTWSRTFGVPIKISHMAKKKLWSIRNRSRRL